MSDLWRILLTVVVGFGTGVLSGMFGIGGAVVSTPAIRVLGATPLAAVGSTIPSVLPSAVTGTIRYRRAGLIHWRIVVWTSAAGVIAAVGGALLTSVVPGNGHPLMILTAAMVGFSAYRLSRPVEIPEPEQIVPLEGATDAGPGTARSHEGSRRDEAWRLLVIGTAAGGLSGLLGIGGGVLMVPLFTSWVRLSIKEALATSLACVGVLAIPGMITHAALGHIDWLFALPLCVSVVPGARLGAHLTLRS
ncbi:MAG TPA: sulfite exporter TauE/SafE family protein, partial [Acidimicrobiia bacterium]|nr:sulfite exporter TauE/SafE family protein [Acidimicrobiia bacterium]